jgi:hypothetical protein
LVLAFAGATATPARVVESTRLVVSMCRVDEPRDARVEIRRPPAALPFALTSVASPAPGPAPARATAPLPHALFQRPPPILT